MVISFEKMKMAVFYGMCESDGVQNCYNSLSSRQNTRVFVLL